MPTSQNGYSANDRSVIASYTVPGSNRQLALRKGDVSVVLLDLAGWMHANIRPIDLGQLDDWGYAERTIRGSATTLSNHASGTAFDFDALRHPLGVAGTWTAEEKAKIHGRLALYDGVIRWGEDYSGRLDGMHFEINRGAAAVAAVAEKLRRRASAPSIAPAPAAVTPQLLPEDDDMRIPIERIDAAGRFHEAVGAEAGGGSRYAPHGVVTFGSTYGGTIWAVTALASDGKVLTQWRDVRTPNNTNVDRVLPDGTRCVTVEGQVDNTGTRPWASYWPLA